LTKGQAFRRHFSISAAVVGIAMAIIFFVWYPAPYFQIAGAWSVVQILIGVDLILGPLLTLILYRAGKPGLVFDLCVVAAIQLSALVYGLTVIYQERPYFTVFVIDRFEVWAEKDIDYRAIEDEYLKQKPWIGPIYAIAAMPDSDEERAQIMEGLFEGKPDIDRLPRYWSPYQAHAEIVVARGISLEELKATRPDAAEKIDTVINAHRDTTDLIGLPVMGKEDVYVLVLEGAIPMPVDLIKLNPWLRPAPEDDVSIEPAKAQAPAEDASG